MKGHLKERSPGRWAIILDLPSEGGKRRRKWHSFKGTKREAQTECARLITAMSKGEYVEPSKATLAQFLARWLDHISTQVSPKTFERYSGIVNQNIIPALGAVVLGKLKAKNISAAYSTALKSGRRDGGEGGLAPRTVGHMHRVLRHALSQAIAWEEISRNPADVVSPPKVDDAPMQIYNMDQTSELLDFVRGTPIFIPAMLAVMCGLRRGEICALRWRNIDLVTGQLSVVQSLEQTKGGDKGLRFKSPKSGKTRTVRLSATVVDELRAYRARRAQDLLRLGVGLSDEGLVVAHEDGSRIQPIYISQLWARTIKRSSLPRLRFHDLRHAHATHLLAGGVHPKIASERLGHSKVGITMDLYSHVIPGMQDDAAAMIDDAFKAAGQKREANGSNPVAGRISGTERE
jgi:integrase